MANISVERFRKLTANLQKDILSNAVNELNRQAQILAHTIEGVAPVYSGPPVEGVEPGALKTTVNVIPDRRKETIVRVIAGGPVTTPKGRAKPFDYSRAVEFGTVEMKAEPFFFPTYRLMKKRMIAAMKRRITTQIRKYSAEPGAGAGGNV